MAGRKVSEENRQGAVGLRARPEAVGEVQSGLMLRALSYCGNSCFGDQGKIPSAILNGDRTAS